MHSFLSVVHLKKSNDVLWFDEFDPEYALKGQELWEKNNIKCKRIFINENEYIAEFLFFDLDHYNDFHNFYLHTPENLTRTIYNNKSNIEWTRIYLGPKNQYPNLYKIF